jgi:iron-sulfur cluster repair protein YtfE (RIC family)
VSNLLETLRRQHREIAEIAKRVTSALNDEDPAALRPALDALRVALLAHLATEDAQLYPALTHAAIGATLDMPARIARTYEHNMVAVSTALKAFLEMYANKIELDNFRRDWVLVSQLLDDRIESEEATLYPLYSAWLKTL